MKSEPTDNFYDMTAPETFGQLLKWLKDGHTVGAGRLAIHALEIAVMVAGPNATVYQKPKRPRVRFRTRKFKYWDDSK